MKFIILAAAAMTIASAARADIYSHQDSNDPRMWMMPASPPPAQNDWRQFAPSQQPQYQPQQQCRFVNGFVVCQ